MTIFTWHLHFNLIQFAIYKSYNVIVLTVYFQYLFFFLRRHRWKRQDVSRRGSTVCCMVSSRVRWPGTVLFRGDMFRIVFRQSYIHAPSRGTATRRLLASSRIRHPESPTPRIRRRSLRARDTTTAISLIRAAQLRRHHQGL